MNINKIVEVSISGIGFTLTESGYSALSSYINSLKKSYSKSPDGEEIVTDIEARIVELILSKESAEGVISDETIYGIIEQMGAPEEIGLGGKGSDGEQGSRFPRRLYRDMDGAKLGGVCNGLARFLDIDPTVVRLSMFVPLVALIILPSIGFHYLNGFLGSIFGATMLLYFVMWLVVPVARSPRQRLEMRGEKITASSIHEGAGERPFDSSQGDRRGSIFSQFFIIMGRIMLFFIKAVAILIGFSVGVCVIALVMTIGVALFVDGALLMSYVPHIILDIGIGMWITRLLILLILVICLLPLVIIAYQALRIAFGVRNNALLMWILTGCWLIAMIALSVFTINNYHTIKKSIKSGYIYERTIERLIPEELDGVIIIDGDTILKAKRERKYKKVELERALRSLERNDSIKSIEIEMDNGGDRGSVSIKIREKGRVESDSYKVTGEECEEDTDRE